jgi:hypothetical protein
MKIFACPFILTHGEDDEASFAHETPRTHEEDIVEKHFMLLQRLLLFEVKDDEDT